MGKSSFRRAASLILIGLAACGGQAGAPHASSPPVAAVPVAQKDAPQPADGAAVAQQATDDDDDADNLAQGGDLGPIPVTSADPVWGKSTAPATLVIFGDFQCPFTARLMGTLAQLEEQYGRERLRVVWKNNPLPFHSNARPAAIAGQTVFRLGGSKAFWKFHAQAFANQRDLSPENYEKWAADAGVNPARFRDAFAREEFAAKIDDDMRLGKTAGITGTPMSFVNGVLLSGAQPVDRFQAVIDEQIKKGEALAASGTPKRMVYAQLAAQNKAAAPPPSAPPAPSAPPPNAIPDTAVVKVPIAGSPARGKATALVTMVIFSDFQCPFCARVEPTVKKLAADYGDNLRLVWKNNPLPFHPRAEPAAELALEARAQKGDAGFWAVHDLIYSQQGAPKLEDQDLEDIAKAAGLKVPAAMSAVQQHKYKAKIEEDQDLADDVQASGTPTFFINGRRLVGAQPIEKFKELIDEQLGLAQALVKKGTAPAKVYDAIQQNAVSGPAPETVKVPPPSKDNPSRGPQNAKVVVQIWSDFQCPFCKRVEPTLEDLDKAFPGKIRFVWHNLPLAMHPRAEPSAELAMEAFRQKGAAAFWSMHDLLFNAQGTPGGLERQNLEQLGQQLGLDMTKVRDALDNATHKAEIEADQKIATAAGITGTPGFAVNNYKLSGAQPLAKFKKLVERALREAK